jgi:hypothetical protein
MRSALFWNFTHRGMVGVYRRFGTTYIPSYRVKSRLSRNVGTELPFHAAIADPSDIAAEARNQVSTCLMQWLRRLVTGHLLRRTGFKPRPVHVRFVVGKVTDRFFSEYFGFPFRIILPVLHTPVPPVANVVYSLHQAASLNNIL